jgi:putative oxidoreductase
MSDALILSGRFLLGLYFLVPGLMKFAAPDMHVALMEAHNVSTAEPLMWVAAVANVAGGLLLISGRHVRLTALGLVLYVLLVNALLHDFWNDHAGVSSEREMQNFIKNLGILAGLLVLAGHSVARPLTLGGWWRSDRAVSRSRDAALVAGSIPR